MGRRVLKVTVNEGEGEEGGGGGQDPFLTMGSEIP